MSIPRHLHFIWVGSEIPVALHDNVIKWGQLNPDWTTFLWRDDDRPSLYNEDLYLRAAEYVPAHAVGQFRADILRYELLYHYGGFYADVDTLPLRPLGDVLGGLTEFAVMEDSEWIANTYLASEPNRPVFRALIERMKDNSDRQRGMAATKLSGPQYLTPIWREFGGHVDERTELWFPYSWRDVKRGIKEVHLPDDCYAVHEWAHQKGLK